MIIPENAYMVGIEFTHQARVRPMYVTMGAGTIPFPGALTANEMAQTIGQQVDNSGNLWGDVALIDNNWTLSRILVTKMTNTGPVPGEFSVNISGTANFETLPYNCAILVRKGTARGGRSGRGRWYLPPAYLQESGASESGVLSPTIITQVTGRCTVFMNSLIAADVQPLLLHATPGVTPDPITSFACQNIIATQRRRLRR